ncbi:respiratory nitrate reductase subunit gamma [Streptomyces sp. NPDC046465]|uniref:respiratory nitrate reductase subunit gamma n=1 Tax=Streptomyces sp. NPDC046465 TaxID=3155810 RepID=UPI0033BFCEBD
MILAGITATATTLEPHSYDYRLGVSVWFRSLFALWPFSRLVHAFTAPVGYLVRPYVIYRSRPAVFRR